MKKTVFLLIALSPLLVATYFVYALCFQTTFLQDTYLKYIRNINFECFEVNDLPYVYAMKPGECTLNNIEYQTVQHHDANGFRNPPERMAQAEIFALGDSHTYGFGVNDDELYSTVLTRDHHLPTYNLAISTYATLREIEAFKKLGKPAKAIIIQYCENDYDENKVSLEVPAAEFQVVVRNMIVQLFAIYDEGKKSKPLEKYRAIANDLTSHAYLDKSAERDKVISRDLNVEAIAFAEILRRYEDILGKSKIIVFESSSYGYNSPDFKPVFESKLRSINPNLDITVLDAYQVLTGSDYYFLDDHGRPSAHRKIAGMIRDVLKQ